MLPKLIVPNYTLTLPSNDKKISYRPFLVKEEKIMLIAAQSQDPEEIKIAIKQIISNCVLDPDFKVDDTPLFDIEWILINLRIKSIGGTIENEYVCQQIDKATNDKCGTPFKIKINLPDVEIVKDDKLSNDIKLNGQVGVKLRYPRFSVINDSSTSDYDFTILKEIIEFVYDANGTYKFSEQTDEEVEEFLESLTKDQFKKLAEFLAGLPKYEINKTHKCEKCGFEHNVKVTDLQSFF